MLQVRVTYLNERVFAASYLDRNAVEWPPHPDRLFAALRAAIADGGLGDAARAALRWLEARPAPVVVAGEATPREVRTHFVPVNHKDFGGLERGRQPRTFPSASLEHAVVDFVWADAAPEDVLAALQPVCAAMSRLGHSASFVAATASDVDRPEPDGRRVLRPDPYGAELLRVPEPGRLDELEATFAAGRWASPARVERYGTGAPPRARSDWSIAAILAWTNRDPRLPVVEDALLWTQAIRAAWQARLGEGGAEVPAFVHGHDGAHVALMPLARVGDRHADGRIHGLAVLHPRDPESGSSKLRPEDAARLVAAIGALQGGELLTPVGRGALVADPTSRATLAANTWTGPAQSWATITPVVLDRFPKRGQTPEDILRASMSAAGLPQPEIVACSRFVPLHGTPPASAYKVRRDGQPPALWHHAVLRFSAPIEGPIGLGRLRHFGLGWFRPVADAVLDGWLAEGA